MENPPGGTGSTGSWKATRGSVFAGPSTFFAEKQAVVIDFGRAYTKVGFAAESRPRHIFRSPELRARRRLGEDVSCTLTHEEWVDILDKLLSNIFFHYLSVSPKDRRVVVCDAAFSAAQFRSALAFVLFKRLSVPSAAFVIDMVLPLYLTGLSSGIVVDCGYESARVMPAFAGVPVLSAFSESFGAKEILARLRTAVTASLPQGDSDGLDSEYLWEDLMVRSCYVSCEFPPKEAPRSLKSNKAAALLLPGRDDAVVVSEACRREAIAEALFAPDEAKDEAPPGSTCQGIQEAFVRALRRCPIDVRAAVVQNVVVCGGLASLRGLLPRLALELQAALRRQPDMAPLADKLLFTPLDFAPICAVWTGGAVFGSLEGSEANFSAEDYEKGKPLPDWLRDGFL
ncbi:unnamed protein product [Polarella glacialis]|uniref:Uncharacterized protein n=1 Tax=Polarella glacialis TaxID=89957 RepID=A0A813K8Q3_POLGL|nr:unnamed protein product [Polarella glacialis]